MYEEDTDSVTNKETKLQNIISEFGRYAREESWLWMWEITIL